MNSPKQTLPEQKPYTLWGRLQRLFGVYIPPKRIITGKRYRTLRFCITGVIPSKKNDYYSENNYRMIMGKAFESKNPKQFLFENLKSWIRGSKKYLEWVEKIEPVIHEQAAFWGQKYSFIFPLECVSIKTYHYYSDRTARDLINKDESVYDMLVKLKIIADDNYGVLYKTASEGGCYKDEIVDHITTIDITVPVFD